MKMPIRARLTAWYVGLLALILIATGAFVITRLRADLRGEVDESLTSAAVQIARGYQSEGEKDFRDVSKTVFAPPIEGAVAQVIDPDGRVVLSQGGGVSRQAMIGPPVRRRALDGRARLTTYLGPSSDPYRVVAIGVHRASAVQIVVAGRSLQDSDRSVRHLLSLLALALPVALAATAAGGWLLARKALRPVERITDQAETIGIDRLDDRVAVPNSSDEISHLAQTFNSMLDRLQGGVDQRRRLVSDASHELRTPIAAMRAELEVSLLDEALPASARAVLLSALEEVDHMGRLVANLLTLARVDEGQLELELEPVSLDEVAAEVARSLGSMAARSGAKIELEGASVGVVGDRERLVQVVTNLAANAIKHGGEGVRVRIATWRGERGAGLTVGDSGGGIPREQQSRIFDRFSRVDESRSRGAGGGGLGLAICQEIVTAHGGRLWVESEPGKGSRFSFELPASGPAES
ncbi:MAG: two-component system, OmpR family, sensor kinase [Solirubrobacterales bacterium]|jgi:heavy metal sensor kinase|nr:two-component system, OmpR family, sensor kinase [Solirubrobacterales bacterium]